jgi:hypothetical protein
MRPDVKDILIYRHLRVDSKDFYMVQLNETGDLLKFDVK